jgi:hypothetical protein
LVVCRSERVSCVALCIAHLWVSFGAATQAMQHNRITSKVTLWDNKYCTVNTPIKDSLKIDVGYPPTSTVTPNLFVVTVIVDGKSQPYEFTQ